MTATIPIKQKKYKLSNQWNEPAFSKIIPIFRCGNIWNKIFKSFEFISKEKGVLVLNTSKLNNIEFQKRLDNLVLKEIDLDTHLIYYKNGNLITKEVTDNGKNFKQIIGQIRRSDIRQFLRDILTKKKSLDKEFSRKYGFEYDEKAFREIESFIQRQ